MNRQDYIKQSRRHYRSYYRLVSVAVILMMAVLTGSLLLGDSVRGTLVQRVEERLGRTESILTSGTGFMDERILQNDLLEESEGVLLVDGYISQSNKLIPVYVWGIDNDSLPEGNAWVNDPLSARLEGTGDIVLHLPSHNMVPSGSLFVTQSYSTQMRLRVTGHRSVQQGGNILLKNEQTLPLNIFVSRASLGEVMEIEHKINLILSATPITYDQLGTIWTPSHSGICLNDSSLTYEGIFIPSAIVDTLAPSSRYFAYLVNDLSLSGARTDSVEESSLSSGARTDSAKESSSSLSLSSSLPYSFVTAVDEWRGEALSERDIILSDYAAQSLQANVGDSISMSYFLAKDLKNLETKECRLCVRQIVPLEEFKNDSLLIADFPGLSHVEKCTDWDSDLPIDMDRIRKTDEDYWYQHQQTPKAIVAYSAIRGDWSNAFGSATALRLKADRREAESRLSCQSFITIISPRAEGLFAANNGTDFAGLFMALGFFIIVGGILLMLNPIAEMLHERSTELALYQQVGYSRKRVLRQLFRETFGTMLIASPLGVLAGVLYSGITLWLLAGVWSGATHTEGFALHIHAATLLVSWAIGIAIAIATLYYLLRKSLRESDKPRLSKPMSGSISPALVVLLLTLALFAYNLCCLHSMILFIVCGMMWIVCFGMWLRVWLARRQQAHTPDGWNKAQMVWQTVCASHRRHMLAYWTLALGVFTVFAVGLNRPDFNGKELVEQSTGSYQLYVDCRVPIQYDLNHPDVRRKLLLSGLPDSTHFLPFLRHVQDEASCLNLNRVSTPTVLGVSLDEMQPFGLTPTSPSSSLPCVYIDQESLTWSMMKAVGDTLYYDTQQGPHTPVLIAGTYPTGIFHGNAIMSDADFRSLWPKESGVEVLLVKSSRPDEASELLSTAMSQYGLDVQTTQQRIKMFFEVTDTYLVIFLTLGALGILLGIFSLFVIVRKNLTASQHAITLYRQLGYREAVIRSLLVRENLLVPLYAMLTGAIGSVISISANVAGAGIHTILLAAACLLLLCATLYAGVHLLIRKNIKP